MRYNTYPYLYLLSFVWLLLGLHPYSNAQNSGSPTNTPRVEETEIPPQQDPYALKYGQTISAEDLQTHLKILSSKEYMGRGNGQEGQKMAANYIADYFQSLNLPPVGENGDYFQTVKLALSGGSMDVAAWVNNTQFTFLKDFYCFNRSTSNLQLQTNKITFMGYGIDDAKYSDYGKANVTGQILLVMAGEPMHADSTFWISGTNEPSVWTTDWRKKTDIARQKGAKALLIVTNDIENRVKQYKNYIMGSEMMQLEADVKGSNPSEKILNTFYISRDMARQIMGKKNIDALQADMNKKGKPKNKKTTANIKLSITKNTTTAFVENVLGYIEGSDLKNEIIILTAHYDHLGIEHGDIYHGADDDGSGTSALLEIAQAFAKAKADGHGPRRSILVMLVAGEEKGLLGSRYYTDIAPLFPLKNTVANLNTDMIGRIDENHKDGNYIYIIGADKLSSELHLINEKANQTYTHLQLDYRFNDENDPNRFYYRSDHYNFAKNNIPVIFYFNGVHEDYHKPTDTEEKINYPAMTKRAQLTFYTAWELANRSKRIVVDSNKK